MIQAVYTGARAELKGKTALLRGQDQITERGNAQVLVQFDDLSTGFGLGWHAFPAADFEPVHWYEEDCYDND